METRAGNVLENTRSCSRDSVRVLMAYDGSGRRVSKTRYSKACVSDEADGVYAADWEHELVTHYTGIGTEVRENYRNNALEKTKVVVNMPQGLGRYGVEDAEKPSSGNATFEWYLKNHLGSTMMVAKVLSSNAPAEVSAAYDYRAFGEQITLSEPTDKVTENFTGIRLRGECCEHACMFIAEPMGLGAKRKERDDETALNYFGARYLDPMLGLWTSVDPARQFASPYLYAGNGVNPIGAIDDDGNELETTTLFGFSIAVGFGIMFRIDYVSNTENPDDCGFAFVFGVGPGVEVGVPNLTNQEFVENSVKYVGNMAGSTLNNSIDKANVNDLSGSGYEVHIGLGLTGTYDEQSDLKSIGFGSVGGGAEYTGAKYTVKPE